ncbi:type II toxin-antitoxin system HicB family antitoxin, partial [Desulfosporosinus sp. BG]|uniref:type II toxin-antitoxin system HicB family antitoxin n=1 Tax=Desulfosporosinus sp. BG TaxID=1633135 RepID=UPI001FA76105
YKNMKREYFMKYAYPAIFAPEEEGGYGVVVPDLPGCVPCGNNVIDAPHRVRSCSIFFGCN